MQGLSKPGTNAHLKHSSFQVDMHALVCYFRLCGVQQYIVAHVELESVSITRTIVTLPYNIFSRLSGAVSNTKNLLAIPVYIELHGSLEWKMA